MNKNILIADDDKDMLDAYEAIFSTKKDCFINFFQNGIALLEYFEEKYKKGIRFPLCIVDMRMPLMSGMETAEKIREIDPDVIILIVTGHKRDLDLENLEKNLRENIYYIEKPFGYKELYCLTDSFLKGWNKNRQLKESEEKYRTITESISDNIWILDLMNLHFTYISPSIQKLLGYTLEEAINHSLENQLTPDSLKKAMAILQGELEKEKEENVDPERWRTLELEEIHKNGHIVNTEVKVKFLRDATGKPFQILGVTRDITERKKAEEALKESEKRYKELADLLPQFVFETDREGNFTFSNQYGFETFGYSREEFVKGLNVFQVLAPGDRERAKDVVAKISRGEMTRSPGYEYRALKKNGHVFPVIIYSTPVIRENNYHGLRGIAINITEIRETEEALAFERAQLLSIFDSINEMIYVIEPITHEVLYSNRFVKDFLGKDPAGSLCYKVFHGLQSSCNFCKKKINSDSKEAYQKEYFNPLFKRDYIITDRFIKWPDGRDVKFVIAIDITERKKAEKERVRLATAIEQSAECVVITNVGGNIQYVNPAFEKITGYKKEEASGKNPRVLKSGKHDKEFYRNLWQTITSGRVWSGHFINKKKDGTFYEEEATISPVLDKNGNVTNYVAVKRDVTEKIKLENYLRQSQKMEAIGNLAVGIAHDFNNILVAILGYTEVALYDTPEGSVTRKNLMMVKKSAKRATNLIKQILTFSRKSEPVKKPVKISFVVREALDLLRPLLPKNIKVLEDIKSSAMVLADPTQIHQIIMNLATNAAYAMKKSGGILEVTLADITGPGDKGISGENLSRTPYIKLTVLDTGEGINNDTMERLFEPYFTTKKQGEGSGMGLAVVHGIVKGYGGEITVESTPGKGSAFYIFLPAIEGEKESEELGNKEDLARGNETILLVDDEEMLVVEFLSQILEDLGYNVIAKTCSLEALKEFEEDPEKFDLVITDQIMPELTGSELAKELLLIRPDIPVILCTGFSEVISPEKVKEIGIKEFVMKPFDIKQLAKLIRKVLGNKS